MKQTQSETILMALLQFKIYCKRQIKNNKTNKRLCNQYKDELINIDEVIKALNCENKKMMVSTRRYLNL